MNNCSLYENLQFTWIFAVLHEHRNFSKSGWGSFTWIFAGGAPGIQLPCPATTKWKEPACFLAVERQVFSVSASAKKHSFLVFLGNFTFWIFAVWPRATAPVEGTAPFVGFSLTWTNIITKSAFLFNGFNKRSSPNFNSLDWCYVVFFWFRLLNENCVYYLLIFAVVRETQDGRERSGVSVFKSWFITLLQLEPQYCGCLYKLAIPIVKLALLLSIDANAHYNRFMIPHIYQLRYNS